MSPSSTLIHVPFILHSELINLYKQKNFQLNKFNK
jgi:hypothetical protein